jgi:predicted transcriptional regulator
MELTIAVVTAFVGKNSINPKALPQLIKSVHETIDSLAGVPKKRQATQTLTCRECGARLKVLRRHLLTKHGLLPEDYRTRWSLPANYPMTAPAYSDERRELTVQSRRRQWGTHGRVKSAASA